MMGAGRKPDEFLDDAQPGEPDSALRRFGEHEFPFAGCDTAHGQIL
jgi:hypothetical protein